MTHDSMPRQQSIQQESLPWVLEDSEERGGGDFSRNFWAKRELPVCSTAFLSLILLFSFSFSLSTVFNPRSYASTDSGFIVLMAVLL